MNTHIRAAWKPLAALGLALALAGCNGTTGGAGGLTGGSAGGSADAIATVGGTPITRAELTKILEAQSGAQYLPVLIDTQLLVQAAQDAGVTVSDADIAAELEVQKKSNPGLAEELAKNPMLLDVVNTQVRRNLVSQRFLTKDVKATDAEVEKFFNTYKSYYQQPTKVKIGTLVTATKARADAMSRAIKSNSKTFAQLVEEQKKSSDQLASRSSLGEEFVPPDTLPQVYGPDEAKAIEKLSKGGTTDVRTINIGQAEPIYVLFHLTDRQEPAKVDFATVKPQVETDYKLAQVAQQEVKKNPQNPPFAETLTTTRSFLYQQLQQQQQSNPLAPPPEQPSLRDVLTVILQPLQQNTLRELRAKGTVQINDAKYKEVADQYKPEPTPVAGAATAGAATAGAPAAPAPGAPAPGAPAPGAPAASAPAVSAPAAEPPAPAPPTP